MAARQKPPANLQVRPDSRDEELSVAELEHISLFGQLKEHPEFGELPGTVLLRRFQKDDVICRLGESGWTAFYILTRKDLLELRQQQKKQLEEQKGANGPSRDRIQFLDQEIRRLEGLPDQTRPKVAKVLLGSPPPQTFWERIKQLPLFRRSGSRRNIEPVFLDDGELFGEMSCMYRMPRSATVIVAENDCYMLEMYRNLLDKMLTNRNKAFKEQIDRNYRKRVLELHLRALPLFDELEPELFISLRDQVELVESGPGELIFDENERSDSMYLIRSGFVQVMKDSTHLLSIDTISNWSELGKNILLGEQETAGPKQKIWTLLADEKVRTNLRRAAQNEELADPEKQAVVDALNDVLRQPKLAADPAFKEVLTTLGSADEVKKLSSNPKRWEQHQQVRGLNRRLLDAVFPGLFLQYFRSKDNYRVLSYQSMGGMIGEMGLLSGLPRNATCIAYDHPESKFGRVEMVRVSKELFERMLREAGPAVQERLRSRIDAIVASRTRHTAELVSRPAWEEISPAVLTRRFDELGLIQGQKLFLIDLDRCTRCDECVKGCVGTHDDGRSRLFLDGPRFRAFDEGRLKNFMVPSTCRMCRDPVCLISCPVGSIHKGETGQIVIEDWCIGCARCAEQCPYGSIQMHPIGIIPRGSRHWCLQAGSVSGNGRQAWQDPAFNDSSWISAAAPFSLLKANFPTLPGEVRFRHGFHLDPLALGERKIFLHIFSRSPNLSVWVNGHPLLANVDAGKIAKAEKDKGVEWHFEIVFENGKPSGPNLATTATVVLRPGKNVVAIAAAPTTDKAQVMLDVGLYEFSRPVVPNDLSEGLAQERIMNTAVVCDMCSSDSGSHPACVRACPHEAAMRVDARTYFSEQLKGISLAVTGKKS